MITRTDLEQLYDKAWNHGFWNGVVMSSLIAGLSLFVCLLFSN